MEPTEIQEFSKQMREAGEAALTRISLAISVLAVLVAMITVLSHRTHTEAVLMQSRAGDQWNEYQAKKIRSDAAANTIDLLSFTAGANTPQAMANRADYQAHIQKWAGDLAEEQKKAHEFEQEVDVAERKAARFDLGEALLQIAVVLSSITLITRQRSFFFLGLALGLAGLIISASTLTLH